MNARSATSSCGYYINSRFLICHDFSRLPLHLSALICAETVKGRKIWMQRGDGKLFSVDWLRSWKEILLLFKATPFVVLRAVNHRTSTSPWMLGDAWLTWPLTLFLPLVPCRCSATGPSGLSSLLCWSSPLRSRCVRCTCLQEVKQGRKKTPRVIVLHNKFITAVPHRTRGPARINCHVV